MIGSISPIAVAAVTNNGGFYEIACTEPHGITSGDSVTIAGCRNASGALIAALNATYTVTLFDSTHFNIPVSYAAGYSDGGAVWVGGSTVSSATLTSFDTVLATRVVDKTGDVLFGQYTMTHGYPSINATGAGSSILTTVAGAKIQAAGGINFVLGDGDDVVLLPPRSRTIMVSCTEVLNQYGVDGAMFSAGYLNDLGTPLGIASTTDGVIDTSVKKFWIPLTRMHDKAVLTSATLFFFPSPIAADFRLPTVFPTFALYRLDPATDTLSTCMAATGIVPFAAPKTAAAYGQTPAVGASGSITLATVNGGSASLVAGQQLFDAAGNLFQVVTSGTYASAAPVAVQAVAPPQPAVFRGGGTNHTEGDLLTWVSAPANCQVNQPVGDGGLIGGLNAGYAQSIVFTPTGTFGEVDQSTYLYFAVITDDNFATANSTGNSNLNTVYTAIQLEFSDITAMTPQ